VCHHHRDHALGPRSWASGLNTTGLRARPASGDDRRGRLHCRITSNSVTVGNISILSVPCRASSRSAYGVEAYFDYINSKGGVNGRQLKVDSYDDAFSGQSNESETTTAVGKDFALVGNFSLFDSYGCKVLAANPAVADVSVTSTRAPTPCPPTSARSAVSRALRGPLHYLKKNTEGHQVRRQPRPNTATAIANWQGQEAVMEHLGYHISYVRDISPVETDFTTDVINMRNDHVQFVYLTDLDWQVAAGLVQAMNSRTSTPRCCSRRDRPTPTKYIAAAGGPSATNGLWLGQGTSLYLARTQRSSRR